MRRLASCLFFLVLATGCDACEGLGNDGNTAEGWFAVGPFVPVEAGSSLDIVIVDAHEGRDILTDTEIEGATTTDPAVFTVAATLGNTVTIAAEAAGRAELQFSGVASGHRRDDSIEYEVVESSTFQLAACDGFSRLVLRGRTNYLNFTFEDPYALGAGIYPIVFEPEGSATVNTALSSYDKVAFDVAPDAPDTITVKIDPESGYTGNQEVLEVIDDAPVERLDVFVDRLDTRDSVTPRAIEVIPFVTLPSTGDQASVCAVYNVNTIASAGICGIAADGRVANELTVSTTRLAVLGLSDGLCIVNVILQLAGAIVEGSDSVDVSAPAAPSSGGGGGGGGADFD